MRPAKEKCGSGRPSIGRGSGEAVGVAGARGLLDGGSAGMREAEQFRGLVEGFAERVVDGGAEADVAADILDQQQLRMPAGDEEQHVGRPEIFGEAGGQRVSFEVVDGDQRQAVDERDRLRRREADQQPADQAGAGGCRNRREVAETDAGLGQRRSDDFVETFDMGARGDLGDDAAVAADAAPIASARRSRERCPGRPPHARRQPRRSRRSSSRCRERGGRRGERRSPGALSGRPRMPAAGSICIAPRGRA